MKTFACLLLHFLIYISLVPAQTPTTETLQVAADTLVFQVYPNPVNQSLRLVLPDSEKAHLYLIDVQGRVVRTYADLRGPIAGISLHDLKPGVYLLELRGRRSYYRRIVIE